MKDPRQTAAAFAEALAQRFGSRVESVLLYGSVPREEAVKGVSDINVLVLVDRIDTEVLKGASPLARRWARAGNTAPLLMTWAEWRRAADVFAVELADMIDAHEVLHGRDPLADLEVEPAPLRLQAERELRGKMLQLREGLLLAAENPAEVGRLLLTALPSFTTYLRAALRLAGRQPPTETTMVIREVAGVVDADPSAFLEVWHSRTRGAALRTEVDGPIAAGYYALAERTAAFVDRRSEEVEE